MTLTGQVAIVTGAARGLGAAIAEALAAQGARIVVADVLEEEGTATAEQLTAGGAEAVYVPVDVCDEDAIEAMVAATVERFGGVDALVNNAGLYQDLGHKRPFEDVDPAAWDRVMAVNARGPWLCIRAVVPHMRRAGRGKIVNVASASFHMGVPGFVHYVASKGAVIALTRAIAREVGADGITVNAVAPGLVTTDASRQLSSEEHFSAEARVRAIPRDMQPDDLVGTVVHLCSSASDFLTGQTIIVDGGGVLI